MLAPQHPLAAYRIDLASRPDHLPFSENDGALIAATLRLTTAADLLGDGETAVHEALSFQRTGAEAAASVRNMLETDLVTLEQMQAVGVLHLAHAGLVAYRRIAETIDPLLAGRSIALEARIAWKRGAHDVADTLYRELKVRARAARSAELSIRATIGFAILAQLRGNFPDVRKYAGHALRLATRNGQPELTAIAHQVLMRAAVAAKDWSAAVTHGWLAFSAAGANTDREAETMLNLSQLLFDVGRPEAAIHGFRFVLRAPRTMRMRLPALGGAARAAAALGRRDETQALVSKLLDEASAAPVRYDAATALVEAAEAASLVGANSLSARAHDLAFALIEEYGYHELRFRLATLRSTPIQRLTLKPNAEHVASSVESLRDDRRAPISVAV